MCYEIDNGKTANNYGISYLHVYARKWEHFTQDLAPSQWNKILVNGRKWFKVQIRNTLEDCLIHVFRWKKLNIFISSESGLVRSEYTFKVWSQSTWVNPGDSYVAYCNIPDVEALDIISNLEVMWYHNSQQLTNLCVFLSSELTLRYLCNVRLPQMYNISLEITLTNVQKTDEGNLSCVVYEKFWKNKTKVRGDLLAMKSVPIQLREPIKIIIFKFDFHLYYCTIAVINSIKSSSMSKILVVPSPLQSLSRVLPLVMFYFDFFKAYKGYFH
nr:uncharacterized protein LOC117683702 [Crassostrea gigas]